MLLLVRVILIKPNLKWDTITSLIAKCFKTIKGSNKMEIRIILIPCNHIHRSTICKLLINKQPYNN